MTARLTANVLGGAKMLDQKKIVKSASKIVLLFLGFGMLFMFIANYQGRRTYSPDYPFLIGIFLIGCTFVFFGARQKKDPASDDVVPATALQRCANFFVDIVICNTISITVITYFSEFFAKLVRSYNVTTVSLVSSLVVLLGYYLFFETILQKTPAKLLTGTKVVDENLTKPNMTSILIRTLSRIAPFEPFSIFAKQGLWHDSWSKTYVISE
jgi:hypothetical protein